MTKIECFINNIPKQLNLSNLKQIIATYGKVEKMQLLQTQNSAEEVTSVRISFSKANLANLEKLFRTGIKIGAHKCRVEQIKCIKIEKSVPKKVSIQKISKLMNSSQDLERPQFPADTGPDQALTSSQSGDPGENSEEQSKFDLRSILDPKKFAFPCKLENKKPLRLTQVFNKRLADYESRFKHDFENNLILSKCAWNKASRYRRLSYKLRAQVWKKNVSESAWNIGKI